MTIDLFSNYYLKYIDRDDADALFNTIDTHRTFLSEWLTFITYSLTSEDSNNYIQSLIEDPNFNSQPVFTIRQDNELIGLIGYKDTNVHNGCSELGYWLCEDQQKKGIMTTAMKKLIQHGFESIGLHRIQLRIAVGNMNSRNLAERLGFRSEGILRDAEKVNDNTYRDLEILSLLKPEFYKSF